MLHTVPASLEDEDFLFQVYASVRSDEMLNWGFDERMKQSFLTMQWQAQKQSYATQYPNAEQLLIIYKEFRAGRIIVDRSEKEIRIVDISLLPEYRNQGIGSLMLQQLQQEAKNCDKILRLSVLHTNSALRLYERKGFKQFGGNELYAFMEWKVK